MKRKRWIVGIVIAMLVVLLFPVRTRYKDGGSVRFKAVLYDVTVWHQLDENQPDGFRDGLCIKILGNTVCDRLEDEVVWLEN